MRSTGPTGHRTGAQGRHQVAGADATRVRRQLRPEATIGVAHRECTDSRAYVVVDLTTLPLTPDGEDGGREQLVHPLLQLLTWHAEHLHLPIARCYLLLQRTLRFSDEGSGLDLDPDRQERTQSGREGCHRSLPWSGRCESQVEVLAERLAAGGQGEPEAEQRMGREPLRVRHRQLASPQGPLPHASYVAVTGETDLAGLGETEAQAALAVRKHG